MTVYVVTLYKDLGHDGLKTVYQSFYKKDDMETRKEIIRQFKKTINISSFDETDFVQGRYNVLWYRLNRLFRSEIYYLYLEHFK